jgi:sulfinoalanine decarboxylase/sulfinoalanine decarboxylase/aspartate 1-decarboxylase
MATYKISGPMVEIEKEILRKIAAMISYPETSAGTIPTGGSMSNFMALVMARDKKNPESKYSGDSNKLICYSSRSSHYSMDKNASFSGIGRDNVRYIDTNKKGEMISSEITVQIEEDIKNGLTPFFINATIGTTVMGAIDPIIEIAEICKKYNIWLHLDGAYGGSVIFSEKYKYLVKGIELSDSFCFNPHKTLGCPISTSILLVKEGGNLLNSFSNKANYLYQTDDDEYNLGQTSFECGRRNNALKFWTLWKSLGTKGISEMVDHSYSLADTARKYIKNNSDYTIYSFDNSLSICFNYKDIDPKILCTDLYLKNKLMVGYGEHKGETFIRLVTINRENTTEDILNFFKILESFTENNIE